MALMASLEEYGRVQVTSLAHPETQKGSGPCNGTLAGIF